MERATELALIDELRDLDAAGEKFLDETVAASPVDRYTSAERFALERERLFARVPAIVATSAELDGPGAFLRVELAGRALLLTRDREGAVHAFANACRHRGARLVDDASGCRHRFSCPYHAWTYSNAGDLLAVPHEAAGFPGLDKATRGLRRYGCTERDGLIWVSLAGPDAPDVEHWLAGLAPDLAQYDLGSLAPFAVEDLDLAVNWKILVEGGIEAYHFKVAHRKTIAPLFLDNLSSYQSFGPHLRSVLPRTTLTELAPEARDGWDLRAHANLVYTVLGTTQFLVQEDHVVRIQLEPLAADRTRARLATLVPVDHPAPEHYWQRHHDFTLTTLREDFALGEGIQAGLAQAEEPLLFGRYEGALDAFNRAVDDCIA